MGNKTKQVIYDGALKSFAIQGYNDTTMDQIAEEAGVAKGTLYYNFKTKEDLFIFVMNSGLSLLLEILEEEVKGAPRGNPEIVEKLISAHLRFFQQERDYCRLLVNQIWDSQRKYEQIRLTIQTYFQWMEDQLLAIKEKGDLPSEVDIHTLASSLFGMIGASAMRAIAREQSLDDPELAFSLQKIAKHAIGLK